MNDMKSEMKRLSAAQKEHQKWQKEQSHNDAQLKKLQTELMEMKRTKVSQFMPAKMRLIVKILCFS